MNRVILISSRHEGFFAFFDRYYPELRRAGLEVDFGRVALDGGVHWAILATPDALRQSRELLGFDPVQSKRGRLEPEFRPPRAEQAFAALARLKRGDTSGAVAAFTMTETGAPGPGGQPSEKTVELIVRGTVRILLTSILVDCKPEGLPDEIWPPDDIREAIRNAPASHSGRNGAEILRAWIEGRPATTQPDAQEYGRPGRA